MFNASIATSLIPKFWNLARVTPIFKGGDKSDKSNYRPISILPVISRLFEKLTADQLYRYMNENNMFSSNQSGFRRLHSTLTCLLKNTDDWYSGLDLSKLVGLVFIDLKKVLILSTMISFAKNLIITVYSSVSIMVSILPFKPGTILQSQWD